MIARVTATKGDDFFSMLYCGEAIFGSDTEVDDSRFVLDLRVQMRTLSGSFSLIGQNRIDYDRVY